MRRRRSQRTTVSWMHHAWGRLGKGAGNAFVDCVCVPRFRRRLVSFYKLLRKSYHQLRPMTELGVGSVLLKQKLGRSYMVHRTRARWIPTFGSLCLRELKVVPTDELVFVLELAVTIQGVVFLACFVRWGPSPCHVNGKCDETSRCQV